MACVAILVAILAAAACSSSGKPANEAEAVAARFVDLYVVEIDQQRALELTTGIARQRIEDELEEVKQVRGTGYTAAAASPRVFYERTMFRQTGERARAVFDLRIEMGGVETRRHILVSLTNRDGGQWRVSSFTLQEGPAQAAP